jgi:hypothetical protein
MSSFVEINSQKFQNVSDASKLTGYSRDYIGRLAREQKILATQVGRQWFVSIASLESYAKNADREQKSRQQKLSEERKREREAVKRLQEKEQARIKAEKRKKTHTRFFAVAVLALGIGLGVGLNSIVEVQTLLTREPIAGTLLATIFPVAKEYPIATGNSVEAVSPEAINFSQESMSLSTLEGDAAGVLLLPNEQDSQVTEAEVEAMFSDPVQVTSDESGNRYVVRTTQEGDQQRIPFAIVPVTNSETP